MSLNETYRLYSLREKYCVEIGIHYL